LFVVLRIQETVKYQKYYTVFKIHWIVNINCLVGLYCSVLCAHTCVWYTCIQFLRSFLCENVFRETGIPPMGALLYTSIKRYCLL